MSNFLEVLKHVQPIPKKGRSGGAPRFSPGEVSGIYAAKQRGLSWEQINAALMDAGEPHYKRPQSLATAVHSSAEAHGIPVQKVVMTKKNKQLVTA